MKVSLLFVFLLAWACNSNPVTPGSEFGRIELTKTLNVNGSAQIDMLWVIDNSGSMCQEQEVLAKNFELFIEEIDKTNLDFHIGVTTTDMGGLVADPVSRPGYLQSTPQPVPGLFPACLHKLDDKGKEILDDFEPISKSISRAVGCMKDPSKGFIPTNAEIACIIGNKKNCVLPGICGENGKKKCEREDLFPAPDSYRAIPKVLRASVYKSGGRLDVEKLKADFSCMSFVGTRGWGVEKGLAAAIEVVKPELTGGSLDDPTAQIYDENAVNHGFIRKNARFAVIFVTDENDCSHDGSLDEATTCGGDICEYANIEGVEEGLVSVENLKAQLLENLALSKNRMDFDESEVLVASIHGKPRRFTEEEKPLECTQDTRVKPVCANLLGVAFSGDRYQRFLQSFQDGNYFPAKEDSTQGWLCQGDFSPALKSIGEFVGSSGGGCISESIFPCSQDSDCPSFPFSGDEGLCVERPGSLLGESYCNSGIQVRAELLSPSVEKLEQLKERGFCEEGSVADPTYPNGCVVDPKYYRFDACPAGLEGVKLTWENEKEAKVALAETQLEIRFNSISTNRN